MQHKHVILVALAILVSSAIGLYHSVTGITLLTLITLFGLYKAIEKYKPSLAEKIRSRILSIYRWIIPTKDEAYYANKQRIKDEKERQKILRDGMKKSGKNLISAYGKVHFGFKKRLIGETYTQLPRKHSQPAVFEQKCYYIDGDDIVSRNNQALAVSHANHRKAKTKNKTKK